MSRDAHNVERELERLRALLEQAPDGIFVADLDGRYTDVNQAGCRLLDCSREEIVGKTILDFIPPEDVGRLWQSRELMTQGGVHVDEWRLRRKDGSWVPVEVSAKILPDGRWQGFVRDISERRRASEALRLSEERLRVSIGDSPAVLWNQDRELRYTWIHNPIRLQREQVLGKTDFELLPRDQAEKLTAIKREVLATGAGRRELVRISLDGEIRIYDLTVEPLRDDTGQVHGITCMAWDVSARAFAEERQRFLAEVGKGLMTATPDRAAVLKHLAALALGDFCDWLVVDLVEEGEIRRALVAPSDPRQEALARTVERQPLDRTRPHLTFAALAERRAQLVTGVTVEFLEGLAQCQEHLAVLRALAIHSLITVPLVARDRLLGAIALVSSGDSRRYGEEDLRFAEELARLAALAFDNAQLYASMQRAVTARDQVLGLVAHDLRNPLNAVLLQSQLLRRRDGGPERRRQTASEAITRAARRMNRLIEDMLDVARLDAGTLATAPEPIAAHELLADAVAAHAAAAAAVGVTLRIEPAEALPCVLADRHRLQQVFDNLIGNALKHGGVGGEVSLGAATRPGEVVFHVADKGPGLPAEALERMFDRFWQASAHDRRGAGLGLAIVKGLVEAHGGRVWAESEPGRGVRVCFSLPPAPTAPAEAGDYRTSA